MYSCKSIGCSNTSPPSSDFCNDCASWGFPSRSAFIDPAPTNKVEKASTATLSEQYPQYYKPVGDLTELDVYAVHHLFNIKDASGCLQHASKKLLLSGVRTGGKTPHKDISEARDTLTRWLQLNSSVAVPG